ncbi:hypothetical protein CR513_13059, partial [Mucuna pruriens]
HEFSLSTEEVIFKWFEYLDPRISRDVLGSIIRRLGQDEVISAKTDSISAKPDQASLHGPVAQGSLNSFSTHSIESIISLSLSPFEVVHGAALVFLSIEEVQLKPSLISLYRDHIGSISAKSNSISCRDDYSPSLEDLLKQLATSNLEFQQTMSSSNMQFQQSMNATIQDLKTQGNASVVTLRSGKALPHPASQQLLRSADADSELDADSQALQQRKTIPLSFPN